MGEKPASGDVSDDTARTPTLSTEPPRAKPNDADAGKQLAPGLYLVATPIGNLADLTFRARAVLAAADVIACEDTRTTARLLKAHGIDTPTTAYHEHNAPRARPVLLRRLAGGGRVALVSDAGTPLISDPGYKLVREAVDAGHAVVPVPGPSAPIAALCASGLPTDRFFFYGFLPAKKQARRNAIEELTPLPATLVFFESARRLAATLADLADLLGPRDAVIAREVTKLYEEFRRGTLAELSAALAAGRGRSSGRASDRGGRRVLRCGDRPAAAPGAGGGRHPRRGVEAVRSGDDTLFLTAAIGLPDFPTRDDILREAFRALALGADAVMTARSMDIVEMLAKEEIPVMGHLGLVPRKSTWVGGLRAVGRTGEEAFALYQRFRRLEDAGAVLVEAEVIPGPVMAEISARSGLITVSLGSGTGADVMYLFMEDICGEKETAPRHARAFGNLGRLYAKIQKERIAALKSFKAASMDGTFPADDETAEIAPDALERFLERLEG